MWYQSGFSHGLCNLDNDLFRKLLSCDPLSIARDKSLKKWLDLCFVSAAFRRGKYSDENMRTGGL